MDMIRQQTIGINQPLSFAAGLLQSSQEDSAIFIINKQLLPAVPSADDMRKPPRKFNPKSARHMGEDSVDPPASCQYYAPTLLVPFV